MTITEFDSYWHDRSLPIIRVGLALGLFCSITFRPFDSYYLENTTETAFWIRALVMAPGCAVMLAISFSRWQRRMYFGLATLCLAINTAITYLFIIEGAEVAVIFLLITLQTFIFLFILFRVPFLIATMYGLVIFAVYAGAHLYVEQSNSDAMTYILGGAMGLLMLGGLCWSTQNEAQKLHQTLAELDETQGSLLLAKEKRIRTMREITVYLSHEIRGFLGGAQLSMLETHSSERDKSLKRNMDGISEVLSNANSAVSLSDALVTEQSYEPVTLAPLVESVLDRFPQKVFSRELDESVGVRGNSIRLMQAINAIVDNAVTYSEDGTEISASLNVQGSSVQLAITNVGKELDTLIDGESVFDAFNTSRGLESERHMGLGLFVAKTIVDAHGGTITGRSHAPNTTFTIALPLAYS